jgi:hypothetical protein
METRIVTVGQEGCRCEHARRALIAALLVAGARSRKGARHMYRSVIHLKPRVGGTT